MANSPRNPAYCLHCLLDSNRCGAAFQHGYIGIFEAGFRDAASMQVFFDLVISVSLFRIWMLVDARKRGVAVWPHLIAIPAVGSIAPLAYLIMPGVGGNRESGAP